MYNHDKSAVIFNGILIRAKITLNVSREISLISDDYVLLIIYMYPILIY